MCLLTACADLTASAFFGRGASRACGSSIALMSSNWPRSAVEGDWPGRASLSGPYVLVPRAADAAELTSRRLSGADLNDRDDRSLLAEYRLLESHLDRLILDGRNDMLTTIPEQPYCEQRLALLDKELRRRGVWQ
jgi:hypothetical protein